MGLSAGVAAADPQAAQSTEDSRPAPAVDVRTMTDHELQTELGRVAGKDSLRQQEVVTEMKARGAQFWEAAPAPNGLGLSGGVPVRPGVSVTGTIAYDSYSGSWYVSGGVRVGKPTGPQFTGIAPKPDGLNATGSVKLDIGKDGEFSSTLSLNLSPEGEVTGSYKAKGTVTTPDGRSYEMDVTVTRNADGTVSVGLPDGYSTSTPLPGGGTIDTTTPVDPAEDAKPPEVKGPAPKTPEQQQKKPTGSWTDWFDLSGGLSIDKEIRPAPMPTPTQEEINQALESWGEQQRAAKEQQDAWRAQNRQESQYREALERAQERADAEEAARRAALPDRDHDGVPDEEDATWNQNDTDPTSTDVGDGPEGGKGYPSDRVDTPAPASPPDSDDPNADHDKDGVPDEQDATWNQNDTDPTSTDVGDGPEGGEGYGGDADDGRGSFSGDLDGDGLTGSADATPNQNDTDPSSTDVGDGPEGGEGYGTDGDADGDGLTGSADATPNQNDTDPSSTDVGDGPEGGEGYGGSDFGSGSSDSGSDSGMGSGSDSAADSGGYSGSGSDTGSDSGGYSGSDTGSDSGGYSGSDTGTDSGGVSDSSASDSGGFGDADGDGLSGSADSTPNQNDTDPSSTDVGDGPEGNEGYSGSTDSGTDSGGYGTDPGSGDCACV
ncbi:hypothetical protein [Actinophytocola sp.]|uniref:hypothetical protein n=1 Tax=Actinophytocola sp. TaxID=1872138 RepID=UPI003C7318DD